MTTGAPTRAANATNALALNRKRAPARVGTRQRQRVAAAAVATPTMLRTKKDMRKWAAEQHARGARVILVPTMGGLHAGHISLIDHAASVCANEGDAIVVSVYVNPAQFAPHEDFDTYPRNLDDDVRLIAETKATEHLAVFAPQDMYADEEEDDDNVQPNARLAAERDADSAMPSTLKTHVVPCGSLAAGLCAESRPHFFGGVCTVVLKLFNVTSADVAVFGEKDFQQLCIVRAMVRHLDVPVRVESAPLVRDDDLLALSSRNRGLSEDARLAASSSLPVSMLSVSAAAEADRALTLPADAPPPPPTWEVASCLEARIAKACSEAGGEVDYVTAVDRETLQPIGSVKGCSADIELPDGWTRALPEGARMCAAVVYGGVRLLDNVAL